MQNLQKECLARKVPNIPSVKDYTDTRMYRRKLKKRSYAFAQFNSFLMDQAVLSLNSLIYGEEKRRAEIKRKRDIQRKAAQRVERRSRREQQPAADPYNDYDDDGEFSMDQRLSSLNPL
jgi:hypothetical protein